MFMETVALIFAASTSAAVGGFIAYYVARQRCRAEMAQVQTQLALAEQRTNELSTQCAAANGQVDALRKQVSQADISLAAADARLEAAQVNIQEQKQLLEEAHHQLKDAFARVSAEAL